MSISVFIALWVLFAHLIADWFLQWDEMAVGKGRSLWRLTAHTALVAGVLGAMTGSFLFGTITFVAHWLTDFVTSRLNTRFWPFVPVKQSPRWQKTWRDAEGELAPKLWGLSLRRSRHNFFCCIGVDQFLHQVQLLITAAWLGV